MVLGRNYYRPNKPFNSLKGETFEFVCDEYRLLVEQTSHHPPIHCFHIESEDFIIYGYNYTKVSFNFSGVGIVSLGEKVYYLKNTKETFRDVTFPRAGLKNILFGGERYVFFQGDLKIVCDQTGDYILINFPGLSWTGQKNFSVKGYVANKDGKKQIILKGDWIKYLNAYEVETDKFLFGGESTPFPEDFERFYFFTKQAMNLNNLTEEMLHHLPPTDSRLRPDQRAYEYGDVDLAAKEKHRLEER